MSGTKGEEEAAAVRSSKDILNELFSSFNTSFQEEEGKKKHKKKKKDKRAAHEDSGDGEEDEKKGKKKRKKKGEEEEPEDVDALIKKHRRKVKSEFKGVLVKGVGDILIKNDKLRKEQQEREEGEILEENEEKKEKHKRKKKDKEKREEEDKSHSHHKHHHHHSPPPKEEKKKLSASQAYQLDLLEREERKSASSSSNSSKRRREAPPRTPSPPPLPPPPSHPPRASYYNNWQRGSSNREEYDRERDREGRRRDYYQREDFGNFYDRVTTTSRKGDGRSGFGFVNRSYYDQPVERVDRHHNNDSHRRRSRSRSPPPRRARSRSRSRSPHRRWRRSRSRSRDRRRPEDVIDKAALLEIARKNAAKLMRRGVLPTDIFSRDQIVAIRAGGKSVDELTDYCKRLARKDARGDAISDDEGDGEPHFLHHPFHVKDRPLPQITLNIRNAVPIPLRTPQAMAIESAKLKTVFPVSSGTTHRIKELEWVPVNPEEEEKKKKEAEANSKALVPLEGPKVNAVSPMVREESKEVNPNEKALVPLNKEPSVSVKTSTPPPSKRAGAEVDISDVISLRLKAMRQLSENPNSEDAKKQLESATNMMKHWADAKSLEPKFLTQSELQQGPQAWAKKDQLVNAKEVESPMGLHLLQKMGWRPGEGLGKTKSGDIQPLALEVKTDKKGLTSVLDLKKGPAMPLVFDLSAKHPISSLMELCAKRKWGAPEFDLVFEHGPPHKRQFVYKVVVNGVEYQPCVAVTNKKLAKANAAAFCLQSLGLLPTAAPQQSQETLQTVAPVPEPMPPPISTSGLQNFQPSCYLKTVPVSEYQNSGYGYGTNPNQPPLPPENLLMPPPPPPPPLPQLPK